MNAVAKRREFGDFQTPPALAEAVCERVLALGVRPRIVVESTCGIGAFAHAAARVFGHEATILAADVNTAYVEQARLRAGGDSDVQQFFAADVFAYDWTQRLAGGDGPILIVGNPPWVTTSTLAVLGGANAPQRSSAYGVSGFDAMTGKSNFDVSEWIILESLRWIGRRPGVVAVLCKTSVARKVLRRLWSQGVPTSLCEMRKIDAKRHFDVAVSACLLIVGVNLGAARTFCLIYDDMDSRTISGTIGLFAGSRLVSDALTADRLSELFNPRGGSLWRSGLKHDCSSVMEFTRRGDCLFRATGEQVDIEDTYVYPLYKTSDLTKDFGDGSGRGVLVTQRTIGADTSEIAKIAPRTWSYLQRNANLLAARTSSIYRNKPPFSIFGIGEYSFASWKVAISGLSKRSVFAPLSPRDGKPTMADDTIYFLPCKSRGEAELLTGLLNSDEAQDYLNAHSFADEMRPFTADLLRTLDIRALAKQRGRESELKRVWGDPDGSIL